LARDALHRSVAELADADKLIIEPNSLFADPAKDLLGSAVRRDDVRWALGA
jgi:hypothetical protein